MSRRLCLLALAFAWSLAVVRPVRADDAPRFIPIADADLRFGGTAMKHEHPSWGLLGSALLLPAWRATDSGIVLPMYSFDGSTYDRVVGVLDPDQLLGTETVFLYRQLHVLDLGWKQRLGETLDGKILAEGSYAFNKDTPDEVLTKALYNYFDLGGRAVLTYNDVEDGRKAPLAATLKVYERRYPNFLSLYAEHPDLIPPTLQAAYAGKDARTKDYLGTELGGSAVRWLGDSVRLQVGYTAALRLFRDNYLSDGQGTPGDTKRVDFLNVVTARAQMGEARPWAWGLNVQGWLNASDGNYYDFSQTGKLAFVERNEQFWAPHVAPWIGYTFGSGEAALRPNVRLDLAWMARVFTNRPAQDANGIYRTANDDPANPKPLLERDYDYAATLSGEYPLTKWASVTAGVTGFLTRSNNHFEQFVTYNYQTLTATLGAHLSY